MTLWASSYRVRGFRKLPYYHGHCLVQEGGPFFWVHDDKAEGASTEVLFFYWEIST